MNGMDMPNEAVKNNKRLLPLVYFLLAIFLMVLLHFLLPIVKWRWWPWNLVGIAPMLTGVALNTLADNQFKQHQTTVKPFQSSSALVTDGVFRVSRNPMYLGMTCFLVSLGSWLASLAPLVVIPIFIWWLTVKFIIPEEHGLAEHPNR